MKKLIINAVFVVAVIVIIIAIIWGFSKLRAVETTELDVQETQEEQAIEQKQIVEETQVKVSINNSKNTS